MGNNKSIALLDHHDNQDDQTYSMKRHTSSPSRLSVHVIMTTARAYRVSHCPSRIVAWDSSG